MDDVDVELTQASGQPEDEGGGPHRRGGRGARAPGLVPSDGPEALVQGEHLDLVAPFPQPGHQRPVGEEDHARRHVLPLRERILVWYIRDRIAPDYLPAPVVRLMRGVAKRGPQRVIANSRGSCSPSWSPSSPSAGWRAPSCG